MKPLAFTSNKSFSGKSSMCVSTGKLLMEKGYNVGYMKSLCTLPERVGGNYIDEDVRYILEILELKDDAKDICPLIFTDQIHDKVLEEKICSKSKEHLETIAKSFKRISEKKDIVLIECPKNISYGLFAGVSSKEVCSAVDAKTIIVMKYEDDIVDKVLFFKNYFERFFGGIIINMIPNHNKDRVNEIIIPYLKSCGIKVLGVMFTDKVLSSVSINAIVKHLDGEVLCSEGKINELVETFMIGAMQQEQALKFFRKKANKAVITGGDRADIQLAAIETGAKCLILTGNFQPIAIIQSRAEELGIPMISVKYDTFTAVGKLNELIGYSNLHELKKLDRLMQIVRNSIDLDNIISILKN